MSDQVQDQCMQHLVEHCSDVLWQADLSLFISWVSPSVRSVLGYDAADLTGRCLLELLTPASREFATARLKMRLADELEGKKTGARLMELTLPNRAGKIVHIETSVIPMHTADGKLTGLQGIARDVSDRMRIDERMRQSEQNYRELVEGTSSFVMRWSTDGIISFINAHTCEFFGFLPEELVGRHLVGKIVPDLGSTGQDLRALIARIGSNPEEYQTVEYEMSRWDGSRVWVAWSNATAHDSKGQLIEILSVGHDVSERRQREQQLAYLTVHDPMSGLYNRAYYDTEIDRLSRGRQFPVSIVIASLDNLQQLNEQQGREEGDLLLMKTARLLRDGFRSEDLISRTGGDGFAVILPGFDEQQTTAALIRFRSELAQASKEPPEVYLCMGAGTAHTGSELQRAQREAAAAMAAEKILRKNQRDKHTSENRDKETI